MSMAIIHCEPFGPSLQGCKLPQHFGDDELGQAMTICNQHVAYAVTVTAPPPLIPDFSEGWKACAKVWSTWLDGEEAKKQREREAEVERQRQFVNELAGKLK